MTINDKRQDKKAKSNDRYYLKKEKIKTEWKIEV
jgi:hypothetical protein